MGIGRKSRKLKGKKRQTGRKIRRGTRRSRLGRMSRMKGGANKHDKPGGPGGSDGSDVDVQERSGSASADASGSAPADAPETPAPVDQGITTAIDGISSHCGSVMEKIRKFVQTSDDQFNTKITTKDRVIDDLNSAKNALSTQLSEVMAELAKAQGEHQETLKSLEEAKEAALRDAASEVARLKTELNEAKASGEAGKTSAAEIQRQLDSATSELVTARTDKNTVDAELAKVREEAIAAAAAAKVAADAATAAAEEAREAADKRATERQTEIDRMKAENQTTLDELSEGIRKLREACGKDLIKGYNSMIDKLVANECLEAGQARAFKVPDPG